ncbi:phosphate ABC transporter permease PstA [Fervidibacter sacchari]|uniref:Phosphate transport system permease protein PstA n=1 Tax=Candidatus Fervidibacter sacchari TaxID=1448929 RepID=A0ABT2EN68_9BACT|nr:phosphate ABC transporter permease PstA [Candidatus Fervidibacter sacchari]MCS3919402.1 phosphate transport system permease protein [Candidatus Fervidibacter sacchari]WKU15136.1 phosphate ABC transporter permease PstA [Candidatus Fervidibacter sacchari]
MEVVTAPKVEPEAVRRRRREVLIEWLFLVSAWVALLLTISVLLAILGKLFADGLTRINWQFLTSFPSRRPEEAGIFSAWVGTLYVMTLTAAIALPLGIGAAIYLEEFASRNWFTRLVELNISNLAAIPAIIYGLLGLQVFVRWFRMGESVLAGACTLAIMSLPVIIVASREALRAVPVSIREAALALGATRWQTVRDHVLPLAIPGILTGTILALSRAIGEAAPLVTIGALTFVAFLPKSPLDPFTVLPIQAYNWVSRPQPEFHRNAAAALIVLLALLLLMNSIAIYLRNRYQQRWRI